MDSYIKLKTEQPNPSTEDIDRKSAREIAELINREDHTVASAVHAATEEIAEAIDRYASVISSGGRVFYCGAGTSGRIGLLDAAEILPTYGLENRVIGILAGGSDAMERAKEDAEDDPDAIAGQLRDVYSFGEKDLLIAISASGCAACVAGAVRYAKDAGAFTIAVTCNRKSDLIPLCDLSIVADVGPEVILGSTRMKAGTAQKMILNMLSTGGMIRAGRVRGNRMAFMRPTNQKLVARAVRMIQDATGCDAETAENALRSCENVPAFAMDFIEKEKVEKEKEKI
ncbi:MAG: N-acetylmuramic acid 6-phosphate etherase [Clostridia bacterium]|nr:N-acetylmuramic acid 6-phosphate etherase [Clostridia bacterium]